MNDANAATRSTLLISITQAATELSISRTMLYQLLDQGRLRSIKLGRRCLVDRDSLDSFVRGELAASKEG